MTEYTEYGEHDMYDMYGVGISYNKNMVSCDNAEASMRSVTMSYRNDENKIVYHNQTVYTVQQFFYTNE